MNLLEPLTRAARLEAWAIGDFILNRLVVGALRLGWGLTM